MQRAWINFAKTGDPSIAEGEIKGVGALKWEKYAKEDYPIMTFNSEKCFVQNDPLLENCEQVGDVLELLG